MKGNSSVVKAINKNKYKSGTPEERKAAIKDIEDAFVAYSKSHVNGHKQVVPGLLKRRKAEADQFLATARAELIELEKKASGPSGARQPLVNQQRLL